MPYTPSPEAQASIDQLSADGWALLEVYVDGSARMFKGASELALIQRNGVARGYHLHGGTPAVHLGVQSFITRRWSGRPYALIPKTYRLM
jgi:hypothetical protein